MTKSELFERILYIRKFHRWTQADVGDLINVSRVAVSLWENKDPNKRTQPDLLKLKKLADASGFDFNWLVNDSSVLEVPEGLKPISSEDSAPSTPVFDRRNPVLERLSNAAASIAELSEDGSSDEVIVLAFQMLLTYRRALVENERLRSNHSMQENAFVRSVHTQRDH